MSAFYGQDYLEFLTEPTESILGRLSEAHFQQLENRQTRAWQGQIDYLKSKLKKFEGKIFFEFRIPRMGKRADCILLAANCIFVLEFKVGANSFTRQDLDQVHDYALDLKNFHSGSHDVPIIPILICTNATTPDDIEVSFVFKDLVSDPIKIGELGIDEEISNSLNKIKKIQDSNFSIHHNWEEMAYKPTPTIIEAAQALYQNHDVSAIARSDAGARNLAETNKTVSEIIESAKKNKRKAICFVTGVPGAGKTLVGLNLASTRQKNAEEDHAVFLSGNGPLVKVLVEALARDHVDREKINKKDALRKVRSFIQNIHHFRDEYFKKKDEPIEKVVLFDEAQRAWSKDKATSFMRDKWGEGYEPQSEPEFLLSVMDRHKDWCCVICLIGGGQEINTGEAGIIEWLNAIAQSQSNWEIHLSNLLSDKHYTVDKDARLKIEELGERHSITEKLHLNSSLRSFRAEKLSSFVSALLDNEGDYARNIYNDIKARYPIVMSRDLNKVKRWLRDNSRGSERIGLVASSGGMRLKSEGIFVKQEIQPENWFLNGKDDVRSSFYLEDIATQFDVQGLELDWVGVCWDADLRFLNGAWAPKSFKGTKWQEVSSIDRVKYQINTYRVLLTRARQGMALFVPRGDVADPTRPPEFYNPIYEFFKQIEIDEIL